jgi:protein TonB
MIMMKINLIRTNAILRLLIVIPLSAALIIAVVSCSGSRKASKTHVEIAPPPPPPPPPPIEVFVVVEEMPQFPGGETALMKFITDNIRYPKAAKDKGIQGRVMIRFVVTANGNIDRVEVLKGVDPLLDQEAIRVIKMMPQWTPGRQGGKVVNVWYTIPVTFALS